MAKCRERHPGIPARTGPVGHRFNQSSALTLAAVVGQDVHFIQMSATIHSRGERKADGNVASHLRRHEEAALARRRLEESER